MILPAENVPVITTGCPTVNVTELVAQLNTPVVLVIANVLNVAADCNELIQYVVLFHSPPALLNAIVIVPVADINATLPPPNVKLTVIVPLVPGVGILAI